nr:reverse transcriptase domain-containing protein [Tanacetum cinerariifolium]
MIKVLPLKTAEEVVARERERKARTNLLMALPEDHLEKFHKMADAKEMWKAIKSRFGGNDESKKIQKYLLKQPFKGFSVPASKGLHKGYDRFQTLLSQLEIHGAGVLHEDAIQKFLSVSFLSVSKSQKEGSASYTNEIIHSFFANQSSAPQLDYDDLEQINDDDIKEIDLKWQVAMISMRIKKFYKRTGRNNSGSDKEVKTCSKTCEESYARLKKLYDEQRDKLGDASVEIIAYTLALKKVEAQLLCHQQNQLAYEQKIRFMKIDFDDKTNVLAYHKKLLVEAVKEKEDLKTKFKNWQNSSKIFNRLLNTQMSANDKFRLGYGDYRYGSILSYENEVLQNSDDDSVSNVQENIEKPSFAFTDSVKHVKSPRENVKETSTPNHCPKVENYLIRDCDFHEKRMAKQAALTKSKNKVTGQRENRQDDPHKALKDKGIIDSGCYRHMIGNKAHLADYQKLMGGSIAFGGGNGRITDKGKIKATSVKTASTPIETHKPLVNDEEAADVDVHLYRSMIGSLMYLTAFRTVIMFAVYVCSRFQASLMGSLIQENQANKSAGPKKASNSACTQANDDQGVNSEEIDLHDEHFVLSIWSAYSTTVKSSRDKIQKTTDCKTCEKPHYLLNVVSTPISTVGPSITLNDDEPSYTSMPHLEDIYASLSEGIFIDSSYDDEGVVTCFNNLETTVNVSPTPTTRIHTIYPKTQILSDPLSAVQTRSKVHKKSKTHALMLERLTGNEYYCFLDRVSGYFQIPIDQKDQEKTTFTCPYGTFAYKRMPFGLCNAPGTFQRCMMAIFHDMIEKTMEVFMADFSVFGNSFSTCLTNLKKMLKWCEDTKLALN